MVPSLALILLWAISSDRLFTDWQTQSKQDDLASRAGVPASQLYFALQDERFATTRTLDGASVSAAGLPAARHRTDAAVQAVDGLSSLDSSRADADVRKAIADANRDVQQLSGIRVAADRRALSQSAAFAYYTDLLSDDMDIFEALSQAQNGQVVYAEGDLVDLFWSAEMQSREHAVLARDKATTADRVSLGQWIGSAHYLLDTKVAPVLPEDERAELRTITSSAGWKAMDSAEVALMSTGASDHSSAGAGDARDKWLDGIKSTQPQLRQLMNRRVNDVAAVADSTLHGLLQRLLLIALVGLAAALLVIWTTVRLTGSLRNRIFALRDEALTLQAKLPDVVQRLRSGETVDTDAEVAEVAHGGDELGELGDALNLARRSAVETAVQQAEQQRGFERLLQRIARRTQLLIGLQLKKLDQLERRHEDPEVLEGLFDLDHLTARLRRYEESLVILGGGQPQRRWRRPVPLLDVLRAAQGEVQDYRRIVIEVEERPWISERAVGPMVHILAELMENGATFSRASMPVEVRASVVDRGVTVEVEDRGLGMEVDQYRETNEMMADPPPMDVLSRAEDVRLGLYVVARLAGNLGVGVELRPSAFGGTRAIVYIPSDLVVEAPSSCLDEPKGTEDSAPGTPVDEALPVSGPTASPVVGITRGLPSRARGRAMAKVVPTAARPVERGELSAARAGSRKAAGPERPEDRAALGKLPKRIRQASLSANLKTNPVPEPAPFPTGSDATTTRPEPTRSGAAVGAFQRQSRLARKNPGEDTQSMPGGAEPESTTPSPKDPE